MALLLPAPANPPGDSPSKSKLHIAIKNSTQEQFQWGVSFTSSEIPRVTGDWNVHTGRLEHAGDGEWKLTGQSSPGRTDVRLTVDVEEPGKPSSNIRLY